MDKEELERSMEEFRHQAKEIKEKILNLFKEHPDQFFSTEEILNCLGISAERGFPSIDYRLAFGRVWAEFYETGLTEEFYDEENKTWYYKIAPVGDQVEKWLRRKAEREKLERKWKGENGDV